MSLTCSTMVARRGLGPRKPGESADSRTCRSKAERSRTLMIMDARGIVRASITIMWAACLTCRPQVAAALCPASLMSFYPMGSTSNGLAHKYAFKLSFVDKDPVSLSLKVFEVGGRLVGMMHVPKAEPRSTGSGYGLEVRFWSTSAKESEALQVADVTDSAGGHTMQCDSPAKPFYSTKRRARSSPTPIL